jgi:nucleotide-binding universal stress UspA family protein
MLTVKKILCPTDFSDASKRGLELGISVAQQFGAEIVLLNVVPVIPHLAPDASYNFDVPEYERLLRADAQQQLAALAKTVTGVKVHPVLSQGDAADGIFRAVDENQIDLIVIATAGHTGWERVVFGSVAEKVVRRAKCPVLTVRRA